jgi:rare lipoprotein A
VAVLATAILTGCSASRWESPAEPAVTSAGATPGTAQPAAPKGRSSRGNPPFYEVFGQRYHVMPASSGYREEGVASWYGKKFHGRPTSSGVIYNMHAMTAAHKTLPLPTLVRVTNMRNGRSVVVTVNDRGPFVDNRIIDLSYAAASRLDMIRAGTALVTVEALPVDNRPVPVLAGVQQAPASHMLSPISAAVADDTPESEAVTLFLQIGAFGEQANAMQLKRQLENNGFANVLIHHDAGSQPPLYRVRLGPIEDVAEYDTLVARMAALEIRDTHLVTAGTEAGGLGTTSGGAMPGGG